MSGISDTIVVTHPNRQYSHQLAIALHRAEMLHGYWTGVPARPVFEGTVLRPLGALLERHELIGKIPSDRIEHCFWGPLARRVGLPLPAGWAVDVEHRGMAAFDRWCARRIPDTEAEVVAGAENASLETFRVAKEHGMTTVLEAASFHYAWQDAFYEYPESDAIHARINRRKDREIERADRIHTVSSLARESYLDAGVHPEKVVTTTIGCDLSRFRPRREDEHQTETPFTFIFAGHAGRRKGADLLLQACEQLDREGLSYRVWVAGNADEHLDWACAEAVERLGWIPHDELADRYRRADCFVLPSRHDSFGMVVVEAMASGTPAIVSANTGAREALTEGETGWVVPVDDAGALAEQMRWCVEHPRRVEDMRPDARTSAEEYAWPKYHRRAVEAYRTLMSNSRSETTQI
jgi:glycosyltransferase involved in cell wall biosynthesis